MKALKNLDEVFEDRVQAAPDKTVYTFLQNGEAEVSKVTYGQLMQAATSFGVEFLKKMEPGERAIMLVPNEELFIFGFWGCLRAGILPVPCPAFTEMYVAKTIGNILKILKVTGSRSILTTKKVYQVLHSLAEDKSLLEQLKFIFLDEIVINPTDVLPILSAPPSKEVFLQFTSGSTGNPKGVIVSHQNVLHNLEIAHRLKSKFDPDSSKSQRVLWLPLFHDLGLITGVLGTVLVQESTVLLKPMDFLQDPMCWLRAMTKYRATATAAPNFAFEICHRRATDEDLATLDLSSLNLILTGAEPIRKETEYKFNEKFKSCGWNEKNWFHCYGMAEATIFVSGTDPSEAKFVYIDGGQLLENRIEIVNEGQTGAVSIANCGRADGQDLRIVDPITKRETPQGQVGEIWIASPSVSKGYWNNEDATQETFGNQVVGTSLNFLRTGDLGFIYKENLFITGRLKDLVIIRGKNYYPQDIEMTVDKVHSAVRQGCSAAFSIDEDQEEKLVIVLEAKLRSEEDKSNLVKAVRAAVARDHGIQPYAVEVCLPGTSLKTSSGKIKRQHTKRNWLTQRSSKG